MGEKGSKLAQDSVLMTELLMRKLEPIGGITAKKMFGGHGIFHEGKMFGIVDSKGYGYLKVNDLNKADFEEEGSQQHGKMPYFSIPASVLNDDENLIAWARKALPR